MSGPLLLLLVENEALVREGLRRVLEIDPQFEVICPRCRPARSSRR